METANHTREAPNEAQPNAVLAALGYLPLMFFLPLFGAHEDRFCRFHGRQSLALFAALLLFWLAVLTINIIFGRMMGSIFVLGYLFKTIAWVVHNVAGAVVSLGYLAAVVVGLVKAASGRTWRMPIVGAYVERLESFDA